MKMGGWGEGDSYSKNIKDFKTEGEANYMPPGTFEHRTQYKFKGCMPRKPAQIGPVSRTPRSLWTLEESRLTHQL